MEAAGPKECKWLLTLPVVEQLLTACRLFAQCYPLNHQASGHAVSSSCLQVAYIHMGAAAANHSNMHTVLCAAYSDYTSPPVSILALNFPNRLLALS